MNQCSNILIEIKSVSSLYQRETYQTLIRGLYNERNMRKCYLIFVFNMYLYVTYTFKVKNKKLFAYK